MREILERDEHQQVTAIQREVFQPIEQEIDALVSEAGLEIKESDYKGKDFATLDGDTQFKVMVNEFISMWIDYRAQRDPKMASLQARLEDLITKKDKTAAASLAHPAKIFATNCANEVLSTLTRVRASAVKSETDIPTPAPPPPRVASAGNGNGLAPANDGPIDWSGA